MCASFHHVNYNTAPLLIDFGFMINVCVFAVNSTHCTDDRCVALPSENLNGNKARFAYTSRTKVWMSNRIVRLFIHLHISGKLDVM